MEQGNAAYSRGFARDERFNYLAPEDRYFLARETDPYKLALIGAGNNGFGHIQTAGVEGSSRVVGLYDPHDGSVTSGVEAIRQRRPDREPTVYGSIQEAVSDPDIDGYIISTPNHTHRQVLEEVVKAGKPIFLEKPMATTVEDAAAMVRLGFSAGVPIQVGLQYRFKATYADAIQEVVKQRSLGDVKSMSLQEHRIPFLDKVGQWNKFSSYSGGTLVEKCCHYFDIFNLFAESRPARVFASGRQAANYADFEYHGARADILDSASVIIEYENGIRATFDLAMFVPLFYEEFIVCASGGRLRTFQQEDFLHETGLQSGLELYRGESGTSRLSEPRYAGVVRETGHSGADFYAHRSFLELIAGNDKNAPTVEEGYWSVVIGVAAEESVKTGAPVDIQEFLGRSDERRYW